MQKIFEQIDLIEVQDILDRLWIQYKKHGLEYNLIEDGRVTDWWTVNSVKWIFADFSGKRATWNRYTFVRSFLSLDDKSTIDWFKNNFNIIDDEPKKKISRKRETYIKDPPIEDSPLSILRRFLEFRWFTYKQIERYKENIDALSKELYAENNFYISKDLYKDTLFFPMYDENHIRTGLKMRTVDGTPFSIWKSWNITWWHSWCIYDQIEKDQVIIVEWEVDYITLKTLGFKSVIGNLGWVSSCKEILLRLCKHTDRIILAYDNDTAGQSASLDFWRPHESIQYPDNTIWCDINDLIKRGFNKQDFEKMFRPAKQELYYKRFFFDNKYLEIYDTQEKKYIPKQKLLHFIQQNTWVTEKDIILPMYSWMCYWKWWKKGAYNLFKEETLLTPSETPELSPELEFLFNNLCNYDEKNINWLLSAIAYKYRNINSVRIPAVLFFWPGATWKGLFVKLLTHIFWDDNCLVWLNHYAMDGRFSPDTSCKLVVEYKEIVTTNTQDWKKMMNNLKSKFMEEKISLEKKWQDIQIVDNIAWNILSSNEQRALVLDSWESGNRRFSIIRTGQEKILLDDWQKIEKSIRETSHHFLAYILDKYPPVHNIEALENESKKDLEYLSQSYAERFFNWFELKYPDVNQITIQERNMLIQKYEKEIWDGYDQKDNSFFRNFNNWLSFRISMKAINGYRVYQINKPWRTLSDNESFNLHI